MKIKMHRVSYIVSMLTAILMVAVTPAHAQKEVQKLSGIITDASTGAAIAGASVTIPLFSSAMTNDQGEFTIKVKTYREELLISCPSYESKRIALKGNQPIKVKLNESGFKSVYKDVMTPMGDINNTRLTGSYTSITQDNSLRPVSSSDEVLQGNVAGLNGIVRSGMDGAGLNFFMRGFNSIYTNNQPLLVVDGMVVENRSNGISLIEGYISTPMGTIDIKDIQRISVIKDATTIYGAKGANGVILIETLHSKEQATRISMQAQFGMNFKATPIPVLNADQQRSYLIDMYQSTGKYTSNQIQNLPFVNSEKPVAQSWGYTGNVDYYRYNKNTDWQDLLFQEGVKNKYSLNVTGGDETAIYAINLGYLSNEGLIKGTSYSRFNARVNSEIRFTENLKVKSGMSLVYGIKNLADEGGLMSSNPIFTSLVKSPMTSPNVFVVDGLPSPKLEDVDIFGGSNPAAMGDATEINTNYGFLGSFTIEYRLSKQLTFSTLCGLNYNKDRERVFLPGTGLSYNELPISTVSNESKHRVERLFSLTNESKLAYNQKITDNQELNAIAGMRYMNSTAEDDWGNGYNSASNEYRSISYGLNTLRQVGGSLGHWNWLSYFGTIDYSIKNKYFLNATASYDASSRYGSAISKFQAYPSLSAAWLISSEDIMRNASAINLLKIRGGFFSSGNDDIGNYTTLHYYVPQNFLGNYGLVRGNIVNPALKPERNNKINLGLDAALFNERISFSLDVYKTQVKDMITYSNLSPISGFSTYVSNGGEMKNVGYDISLNARVLNGRVKWDIGATVGHYKNEVTKLSGDAYTTAVADGYVQTKVGQPLGVFYGYKTAGVYSTSADASENQLYTMVGAVKTPFAAGDVRFANLDNNDLIDENDRTQIGDPNPDIFGGINTSLKWKRWNATALCTYSLGNDVYNYSRQVLESENSFKNQTQAVLKRWKYEGQVTDMPKVMYGDPLQNSRFSDRFIEDGSYLKLKNITISYDIPVNKKATFLTGLQAYASVENIYTFTKYKGLDPEFSSTGNPLGYGVDAFMTPQATAFYVGVKIGL